MQRNEILDWFVKQITKVWLLNNNCSSCQLNYKCSSCHELITGTPYSHCGHCKRTLCKKCGYIPGGCGWCGG